MAETQPYLIVNLRNQPLEIVLGAQAVMLPAYGQFPASAEDLAEAQLVTLSRRRLIAIRAAPAPQPAAPEQEAEQTARPRRSRRSGS